MPESASLALALASGNVERGEFWAAASHLRLALGSTESLGEKWIAAITLAGQIGDDYGAVLAAQRLYAETRRQPAHACLLAEALTQAGDPQTAANLLLPLAKVGELTPDQDFKLTRMLMFAGRIDEAQALCRTLLRAHADSPTLWERIAQTKRFRHNDPDLEPMRKVYERWTIARPAGRAAIAAAIAKAFVDIGDDAAADQFLKARATANGARFPFDPRALAEGLRDIVDWCESGAHDPASEAIAGSERPIFILGPARSGTSLLDQVFSCHWAVRGGGELRHFWLAARELEDCSSASIHKFEEHVQSQYNRSDPWAEFGRRYLSLADERFGAGARFTDKLLSNLYRVRAIRRSLPNVRFIYLNRSPIDVAWSCWRSQFDSESAWGNSPEGIAFYIMAYRRAIDAWKRRFPDAFTEISYERLTREPDAEIPRALAGCGLSDDTATRQPQLSTRPVITMSFAQVREPIHTRSVAAAAAFPMATTRLRAALEAVGVDPS